MTAHTMNGAVIAGLVEARTAEGRRLGSWHFDSYLAATALVGALWALGWFAVTSELAALVGALSTLPV